MTTTSDITQIDLNYAAACEAIHAKVPGVDVSVAHHRSDVGTRWTVSIWSALHGNPWGSEVTFELALDACLANIKPAKCPTCGGRMDNECKHSH